MKMRFEKRVWVAAVMIVTLSIPATRGQGQSNQNAQSKSESALRTAIETEIIKGDLKKAIEQYKKHS